MLLGHQVPIKIKGCNDGAFAPAKKKEKKIVIEESARHPLYGSDGSTEEFEHDSA